MFICIPTVHNSANTEKKLPEHAKLAKQQPNNKATTKKNLNSSPESHKTKKTPFNSRR